MSTRPSSLTLGKTQQTHSVSPSNNTGIHKSSDDGSHGVSVKDMGGPSKSPSASKAKKGWLMTFESFKQGLKQEKTALLLKMANEPNTDEMRSELRTINKNIERAEVLYEHFRLGNDVEGPRMLHRRGQRPPEEYRTFQTMLHSVEMTWKGDGDATETLPKPYFFDKAVSAENHLHSQGIIYDPVGVEQKFKQLEPKPKKVLNKPNKDDPVSTPYKGPEKKGHDMQSNFAWLMGAVHRKENFELVGPLTKNNLERGSGKKEASALLREVRALLAIGYEVSKEVKGTEEMPVDVLTPPKDLDPAKITMSSLNQSAPNTLPEELEIQELHEKGLFIEDFDTTKSSSQQNQVYAEVNALVKKRGQMDKKNPQDYSHGQNLDGIKTFVQDDSGSYKVTGTDPLGVKSQSD